MIVMPEYALLPDTDVMPDHHLLKRMGCTMLSGYDRRIPGAAKAAELGMMCEDWDRPTALSDSFADLKVDGWRAIFLGGERPRIVTREGEPLLAADRLLATLQALEFLYGEPMMFDGEFAAPGGIEATTALGRLSTGGDNSGVLWLFDAVPLAAWASGQPYTSGAWERREGLLRRAAMVKRPKVGVLRPKPLLDAASVNAFAAGVWAQGGEGAVVKRGNSPYVRERSADWRKLKQIDRIMARIVSVTPKGTLMCVRDQRPDYAFGVGIGIPETDKVQFLAAADAWVGREVEIEANGYTGKGTPRHARFIAVKRGS